MRGYTGGSRTYNHSGTKLGGSKSERKKKPAIRRAQSASPGAKARSKSKSKSLERERPKTIAKSPTPTTIPKKKKAVSRERERSRSGSRKPSPQRGRNPESKALLDWRQRRRNPSTSGPSRRGARTSPQRRSVSASPMRRPVRGVSPGTMARYLKEGAEIRKGRHTEKTETAAERDARFAKPRYRSISRPPLAPKPKRRSKSPGRSILKSRSRTTSPAAPMDVPTPTRESIRPTPAYKAFKKKYEQPPPAADTRPYSERFPDWKSAPAGKTETQLSAEAQIQRERQEMMAKYGSRRKASPAPAPRQPSPAPRQPSPVSRQPPPSTVPIASQPVQAMAPAQRVGGGPRKQILSSSVPREAGPAAPPVIGYAGDKPVTQMPHKGMGRRRERLRSSSMERRFPGMKTLAPMEIQERTGKRKREREDEVAAQKAKDFEATMPSKAVQWAHGLDKTLGAHQAAPGAPIVKRPRPARSPARTRASRFLSQRAQTDVGESTGTDSRQGRRGERAGGCPRAASAADGRPSPPASHCSCQTDADGRGSRLGSGPIAQCGACGRWKGPS